MTNDPDFCTAKMPHPNRLGWHRRQMALIVTLIGLATFISPLVSTDTEILGQSRWSPFQIITALYAGKLPIADRMSRGFAVFLGVDFLLSVSVVYILLALVAVAILLLPSARFIRFAAVIGAAVVYGNARWEYPDLQDAIYGQPRAFASGHQVHAGTNCLILFCVLLLLAWIAQEKNLE